MPETKRWSGWVVEVEEPAGFFSARLKEGNEELEASIPLGFIQEDDLEWLEPGAYFTLEVKDGQTRVWFHKERWTQVELDNARNEAKRLMERLRLGRNSDGKEED